MKENENPPQIMYLLPNLFTAASCFLGVISIIASFEAHYGKAILFIILSLVFDGLDGRVARLTNTSSKFGVEFDSLADLTAFGIAPAMLFYCIIGQEYHRLGMLIAAIFVVFGAIRLARFNVTTGTYDPKYFIGLPIPTAAVALVTWIWVFTQIEILKDFDWVFLLLTPLLAVLMVSNVRYPSFKKIDIKQAHFFKVLIWLVVIFSLFFIFRLYFLAILTFAYVMYGVVRMIYQLFLVKIKKKRV